MSNQVNAPVPARIESITGPLALCFVEVAGSELPIEMPLSILSPHATKAGDRFLWRIREAGEIAPEDISEVPPNRLTADEEGEASRLYDSLMEAIAAGDRWGLDPRQDR